MKKSQSKIRHIELANVLLEERMLSLKEGSPDDAYGWVSYPNDKVYKYKKRKDSGWVAVNKQTNREFNLSQYPDTLKRLDAEFLPKWDAVTGQYQYTKKPNTPLPPPVLKDKLDGPTISPSDKKKNPNINLPKMNPSDDLNPNYYKPNIHLNNKKETVITNPNKYY